MTDTPDTSEQRITARLRDFVDADGERWFEIRPDWVAWAPTRREAEARSAEVGPHYGWELAAAHRNYELRAIDDTEGQPDSIANGLRIHATTEEN